MIKQTIFSEQMYLDKISMSGTVSVGVPSLLRLVPDVGDVDRDAPLLLLFALVDLVEFDMFRQACKTIFV